MKTVKTLSTHRQIKDGIRRSNFINVYKCLLEVMALESVLIKNQPGGPPGRSILIPVFLAVMV